jgi:biotin synthase-related radical SAM superfamily protein
MKMDGEIKAQLVSIGSADMEESLMKEVLGTTVPSAGPGAGIKSFFLSSGGRRVRLSFNKKSPLKVRRAGPAGSEVIVIKDGVEIARGEIEPALSHCPEQAYLTISGQCIYDCKYCPVPKLHGEVKSVEKLMGLVRDADKEGKLKAISLTSGVGTSTEDEVKKALEVVKALKARYDVPIGVSVYPTETSSEELYGAGAMEIKYNVETMDPEIFSRVCPGLSLPFILKALEKAVGIYGKNRVSSNFIIGLGESDECVQKGVRTLTEMGVIPILRPISPHPLRAGEIFVERPTAERLLKLTRYTKRALEENGLRTGLAETMCLRCTGCDLTPQKDL